MKQYYYTDGKERFGPFELEELKLKGITENTLVWTQGMANWAEAVTVPELSVLFNINVPPVNNYQDFNYNRSRRPPKTWLAESIIVTLLCCMPFGIVAIVYASKVESKFYMGDDYGANKSSDEAKKWVTISAVTGVVFGFIYFFIFMFGALSEY